MNEKANWKDIKFDTIYNEVLRSLKLRRDSDPGCKVEDIERVLNNLYIKDGADLEGPGTVQSINTAATIAAHEHFISVWKAEKGE